MDRKQFFTEDQNTTPLVFGESFVNPNAGGPSSPEDALSSARMVLATELGKDPQLRQLARERFRTGAVINVKPTEKGVHKIDDQHPFAVSVRRFAYCPDSGWWFCLIP
jgi:transcription elongation factor SPT6